jgi:hypothetical protein
MSKPPRRRKSVPRVRIKKTITEESSPENEVGYGKPPRANQFRSGQSGNPKGRPKGAKNEATILLELLNRKIDIREGGKIRKITVLEAILHRVAEDSLRGNTKSAAFILNRHGALASSEPHQSDISDDDRQILEAFAQRLVARRAN